MPNGSMEWKTVNQPLAGFENYNTIEMLYIFPDGYLKDTNTHYTGTGRRAFLPTSPEGIIVFKMLVEAFKRRMSFIVGTSLTTGQKNTVVWAGLHHKTSKYPG